MATKRSGEHHRRGALVDWTTQRWVQATGRRVVLSKGWSRYLKALKENIRVFVDPRGHLRADHNLQIWGATFLRLHYRIRRRAA